LKFFSVSKTSSVQTHYVLITNFFTIVDTPTHHQHTVMSRFMDVPNGTTTPPPVQHFPKETCPSLTRRVPSVPRSLPAGRTGLNHAPTMTGPTTGSCRQRPVTATDMGKGLPGRVETPPTGVSTFKTFCDDGTKNTVTKAWTGTDKRVTRRGNTRTGGYSCTSVVVVLLCAATLLMVDVAQAVFAPADRAALKAAVDRCYLETTDGSCPIFAASDATPGNPYGVIGDWDVSAVTSMYQRKCTLSPSRGRAFHCCVF